MTDDTNKFILDSNDLSLIVVLSIYCFSFFAAPTFQLQLLKMCLFHNLNEETKKT